MNQLKASEPDSSAGHFSQFQVGKRRRGKDVGEPMEQFEGMKFGGVTTAEVEIPYEKKFENFRHHNEEDGTSQITAVTALSLSEKLPMPMDLNAPRTEATVLKLDFPAELAGFDVDLNDPFYPYKKLGQVKSTASSECGSTTGQVEISESMRKWNEMKQNGFVSTIQVKAPITRLKKRQSRKKNDHELKKMVDMTKRELNKNTSVADPCQLLSGLNPGIIKHVRNSKQVNSIIKAILQNEMIEKHHRTIHETKRGSKETIDQPLIPCCRNKEKFSDPVMFKDKLNHESYNSTSEFNSERDDDALTLKLSYSVTIAPEHARKAANNDFPTNQEDITTLSVKAANVALQWLKLIHHDINARLAAIQRSKNRLKNAMEMELPYLFSRDLHPKQENVPLFGHSLSRCSPKGTSNVHLARWKAIFTQMEVSLTDEENLLHRWLRQVEELKSQCQEGLRYGNTNGFLHLDGTNDMRISKSQEAFEKELAVKAAAASIYSTCNMVMTAENVPCF